MRQIKRYACFISILTASCIEPYTPDASAGKEFSYVVWCMLTNIEGYQTVSVSLSTPIGSPKIKPSPGCRVFIEDSNQVFTLNEYEKGKYRTWIDSIDLIPGKSFRLRVLTKDNQEIISDWEKLIPCADIDSIYYEYETQATTDPQHDLQGVRFYLDIKGNQNQSRYYLWEMTETYEYHSPYPITYYWDGTLHHVPTDYSKQICWISLPVQSIYTLSTEGLPNNVFKNISLHFIDNKCNKLKIGYNLLVRQYALNPTSFRYFEFLRQNSIDQGGMFDQQPLNIIGNMQNITHPSQKVLGYFCVASVKQKRYHFNHFDQITFEDVDRCDPTRLEAGFRVFTPEEYPVYLVESNGILMFANPECFDCRLKGGTTDKPEFWPE